MLKREWGLKISGIEFLFLRLEDMSIHTRRGNDFLFQRTHVWQLLVPYELCPYSSAGLFKYVAVSTQKIGWWSQFWLSRFWGIVIPRKRSKKGETYHCFCNFLPTTGLRSKSVTQAAAVSSGLIIVAGGYDAREAQRLGSVSWQIQGVLG